MRRQDGTIMAAKAKQAAADMDAEAEPDEAAKPAKRKLPLKLIMIVVGALVVLGGCGTAGYLFIAHGKEAKAAAVAAVKPPAYVDVPEVLVNLSSASPNDRTQYLKIKVVLELADILLEPQIKAQMPRVMDAFQTYLRELRPTDLDGSAGLYRLKEELTRRVNAAISPNRINAVLFKEIVVQ
jgi:flagellar protein FliL